MLFDKSKMCNSLLFIGKLFFQKNYFFCNTNSYINTSDRRLQEKSTSLSFNSL